MLTSVQAFSLHYDHLKHTCGLMTPWDSGEELEDWLLSDAVAPGFLVTTEIKNTVSTKPDRYIVLGTPLGNVMFCNLAMESKCNTVYMHSSIKFSTTLKNFLGLNQINPSPGVIDQVLGCDVPGREQPNLGQVLHEVFHLWDKKTKPQLDPGG